MDSKTFYAQKPVEFTQDITRSKRSMAQGQEVYAWKSLNAEVGRMALEYIGDGGAATVEVVHERVRGRYPWSGQATLRVIANVTRLETR